MIIYIKNVMLLKLPLNLKMTSAIISKYSYDKCLNIVIISGEAI